MSTIAALYRRFDDFNIEDVAINSIEQTKELIADLNVEQLNKGLKSDGSLMPDYSPVSVEEFGKPEGPIKLFETGDFYHGFRVEVVGDKVVSDSTDSKSDTLYKRYATQKSNIFGLSPLYRREYMHEALKPTFRKNVKQATGL